MNEEKKEGVIDYKPEGSDYFFNWFLYDGEGKIVGIHGNAPDKAKAACKEYAKKHSLAINTIESGWLSEEPSLLGDHIIQGFLAVAIIRAVSQYLWWI
jgi:hypothetical protein